MNYRHAFHAGNFADVVKHTVLFRIVAHLLKKPAPFRIIETHAGAGRYDLGGPEAQRSPEWKDGIARALTHAFEPPAAALMAGYLDAVRACNPAGSLSVYPGSPLLVRSVLRDDDRLLACELEPHAATALTRQLRGDRRAKAVAIDGWTALSAFVPPKERRGLVLIDPPFEHPDEYAVLVEGLSAAWRKWPTGIYLAWYPIKEPEPVAGLIRRLYGSGITRLLRAELVGAGRTDAPGLRGSGQIVVNPPWNLQDELQILFPVLAKCLWAGETHAVRLEMLSR